MARDRKECRSRSAAAAALVVAVIGCTDGRAQAPSAGASERGTGPACEGCPAGDAAAELGPVLVIAPAGEPGERFVLTGTVYARDGRPAAGVLIYAYHANAAGIYPGRGEATGDAGRHGTLRGWLRTGADGRYRIETIKPGPYPGGGPPAHVHMSVQPPGEPEVSIDEVEFADDPRLTAGHRARLRGRGGPGIVALERGADGAWHATRDILLGRL